MADVVRVARARQAARPRGDRSRNSRTATAVGCLDSTRAFFLSRPPAPTRHGASAMWVLASHRCQLLVYSSQRRRDSRIHRAQLPLLQRVVDRPGKRKVLLVVRRSRTNARRARSPSAQACVRTLRHRTGRTPRTPRRRCKAHIRARRRRSCTNRGRERPAGAGQVDPHALEIPLAALAFVSARTRRRCGICGFRRWSRGITRRPDRQRLDLRTGSRPCVAWTTQSCSAEFPCSRNRLRKWWRSPIDLAGIDRLLGGAFEQPCRVPVFDLELELFVVAVDQVALDALDQFDRGSALAWTASWQRNLP